MHSRTLSILCFAAFAFMCSCNSPKNLIYLQDQASDNASANELVKSVRLQNSQYKLKPSDRLMLNIFSLTDERINFIKEPELEVVIDNNGQVDLPVIGKVAVSGLTVREAEEKLKAAATDYLKSPRISVKLLSFNYTVIGEVEKQGSFNATEPRVNILEAIGQAGGLTENANRASVRIIRNENDTARIYRVNLLEDNTLLSPNYYLKPNDVVLIDPLKSNAVRQNRTATIGLIISVISSASFLLWQIFN